MSLDVAQTRQAFPFAYDDVFDGLVAVLDPAGFAITSQDRVIGRITATTRASGFSWGENLAIQLERTAPDRTNVAIQSNLKIGLNLLGSAKNAQNAERIIAVLSNYLQSPVKSVESSVAEAPTQDNSTLRLVIWGAALIVLLFLLLGR